ncbi:hypothetical protein ACGFIY_33390 [Micromonospora chersina]|uniref:hypothetical protein n=1 Tax=Micromonospora chersina TaxID=47854 RepID=UPI00370FD68B
MVAKARITESVEGFQTPLAILAEAGDDGDCPIPVAIETPRGLLVAALRATGRPIYPINPMAVARYRERYSATGKNPTTPTSSCWQTSCFCRHATVHRVQATNLSKRSSGRLPVSRRRPRPTGCRNC